jgi:signal transduction histidine kinase
MGQWVSALRRRIGVWVLRRPPARRRAAWVLAFVGPLVLTLALVPFRSSLGLAGVLFLALLLVVATALVGGLLPALASVAVAIVAAALFHARSNDTVRVDAAVDVVALVAFMVVGTTIGVLIDELTRLSGEQAALRRVATLVARGVPAATLFTVVSEEVGELLGAAATQMIRYRSDGTATSVARWIGPGVEPSPVKRWTLGGTNVTTLVAQTGRPARIDAYGDGSGELGATARGAGVRGSVGAPIIVEGHLWGVMVASAAGERPLHGDTEARLAGFTELVATAIANAESRAELIASRARVVAAADETRRRIERDLHDGTQQRLVSLALELRAAEASVPPELTALSEQVSRTTKGLTDAVEDLQEIARGIHPAILSKGGLGPAIKVLARRSAVPVELDFLADRRLPERTEVAAYYVVSEALTNAVKHAHASVIHVELAVDAEAAVLLLSIRDDGIGGVDPSLGSGLLGLKDRVESLGGTIEVAGNLGGGTAIVARIPFDDRNELDDE